MLIFILTNNVEVDISMLKLVYLAEFVDINLKYIAGNASVMMSLSVGYPQISASGYPDSKFTIRFSPTLNRNRKIPNHFHVKANTYYIFSSSWAANSSCTYITI